MDINEEEGQNLSTIDSIYVDEYDIFRSMNSEIDKLYSNEIPKKTVKQISKKLPKKLPEIIEDLEELEEPIDITPITKVEDEDEDEDED
jgi:acyl-CoA thioesterase